jgi:iron-sulfur cluster assembly protein
MSTTTDIATPPARRALPPLMTLTDAAVERLRALYGKGREGMLLRVAVAAKGCSGHSYVMDFVPAAGPGDEVVTEKGVSVVVDRKATLFLIGTVMDYEVKSLSAGFVFLNPNEKARCGCGESFQV